MTLSAAAETCIRRRMHAFLLRECAFYVSKKAKQRRALGLGQSGHHLLLHASSHLARVSQRAASLARQADENDPAVARMRFAYHEARALEAGHEHVHGLGGDRLRPR